ncbi:unnamed protein product [Linum trigynum]|uniref:Uncharacterized protein n=1 Tax=Linum trigynum TaxID=586398 RepID=A0AAV2GCM3_9ROSI
MGSQSPRKIRVPLLENKKDENVHVEESENEENPVRGKLFGYYSTPPALHLNSKKEMDMNEVEKKEQEDGNGKVLVEAKDEDEKEVGLSTTMNLLTSQLEQTFKEEVAELEEVLDEKEEVLVEVLTIVTCEEDAQALILSQEEPELEVDDEEKVLPITNMIVHFDHDEINLKEGPKQSLIEEKLQIMLS